MIAVTRIYIDRCTDASAPRKAEMTISIYNSINHMGSIILQYISHSYSNLILLIPSKPTTSIMRRIPRQVDDLDLRPYHTSLSLKLHILCTYLFTSALEKSNIKLLTPLTSQPNRRNVLGRTLCAFFLCHLALGKALIVLLPLSSLFIYRSAVKPHDSKNQSTNSYTT